MSQFAAAASDVYFITHDAQETEYLARIQRMRVQAPHTHTYQYILLIAFDPTLELWSTIRGGVMRVV